MSRKMLFGSKFLILLLFLIRERKLTRAIMNDFTQVRGLAGEYALASRLVNGVARAIEPAFNSDFIREPEDGE